MKLFSSTTFVEFFPNADNLNVKCVKRMSEQQMKTTISRHGMRCTVLNGKDKISSYTVKKIVETPGKREYYGVRDIFAFKLLDMMGVGPKVHFVSNGEVGDDVGLFIVTEDEPEFDTSRPRKIRSMERFFLYLLSIPNTRYGADGNGRFVIHDFVISTSPQSSYAPNFMRLHSHGVERSRKTGRQCFERWAINKMIDDADMAIGQEKALIDGDIELNNDNDYWTYVSLVRENVKILYDTIHSNSKK